MFCVKSNVLAVILAIFHPTNNYVLNHFLEILGIVFAAREGRVHVMKPAWMTKYIPSKVAVLVNAVINRHPETAQHDRYQSASFLAKYYTTLMKGFLTLPLKFPQCNRNNGKVGTECSCRPGGIRSSVPSEEKSWLYGPLPPVWNAHQR